MFSTIIIILNIIIIITFFYVIQRSLLTLPEVDQETDNKARARRSAPVNLFVLFIFLAFETWALASKRYSFVTP